MKHTGVKVTKEDLEKLINVVQQGWRHGEVMMVFSVGEGIRKDEKTLTAAKMCHQLALAYGLPEIPGMYGIDNDGEFVYY